MQYIGHFVVVLLFFSFFPSIHHVKKQKDEVKGSERKERTSPSKRPKESRDGSRGSRGIDAREMGKGGTKTCDSMAKSAGNM